MDAMCLVGLALVGIVLFAAFLHETSKERWGNSGLAMVMDCVKILVAFGAIVLIGVVLFGAIQDHPEWMGMALLPIKIVSKTRLERKKDLSGLLRVKKALLCLDDMGVDVEEASEKVDNAIKEIRRIDHRKAFLQTALALLRAPDPMDRFFGRDPLQKRK